MMLFEWLPIILRGIIHKMIQFSEINRPIKSLVGSNVYSAPECAILKWVSVYHCLQLHTIEGIYRNFTKLQDSTGFISLFSYHTNSRFQSYNQNPVDEPQYFNNATELLSRIKELKLSFSPREDEIVQGNSLILCTTLCYYFETLPHFIPQSTIEFSTTLLKPLIKEIVLSNPSKSEIKYTAFLEANENYSIAGDSLVIPPDSQSSFPITFLARTIKQVAGKISFIPSKPKKSVVDGSITQRSESKHPDFFSPIFQSNVQCCINLIECNI